MNEVFIHSFWIFLERLFKSTTTQRRSRHSTDTVSEFPAKAPQETANEGLAQGPGPHVAKTAVCRHQWCSGGGTRGTPFPHFFQRGTRSLTIFQHFWHLFC